MANEANANLGRLGLLVGGGPAPGINGVISAATIEAINQGYEVIGFRDGYKWLAQGDSNHIVPLTINGVTGVHLKGGSILGTSRTNPTKSETDMRNVLEVFKRLGVTALVSIGGDDTAYSASQVHRHSGGSIRVAHVPKTIDNDLPLPGSTPTFGFETARHLGVGIVRNLAEDAKTTSRWYLIISMGRAAGHLALGIGKAAACTLTIIPEEFKGRPVTFEELCDIIIGSIIKRRGEGSQYGVVVLAEGLIEAIGEKALLDAVNSGQLGRYGRVMRDEHNHLRLGEIEFGRMIKDLILARQEELGLKAALVDKDLGYELRSADPIPFDAEYTRDLGYAAVKFILSDTAKNTGAIISFVGGRMQPLRFQDIIDPQTKRMQTRRVNVDSESYECARRYMIRLEREDFEDAEKLSELARTVKMTPEQFRARFGYVAGVGSKGNSMLTKTIIRPKKSPPAVGPYNHAVRVGDMLFCAGQIPIDPASGNLIEGDIKAQTRQVLENVKAILEDQQLGFNHVVKTTVFLTNLADFAGMNEIYSQYLTADHPARSTIQVAALPKNAIVEIEVVAHY